MLIIPADELQIGPYTYTIETIDRLVSATHQRMYGQIDHDQFVLELDSAMSDEKAKAVAIHEITHGIMFAMGYQGDLEELVVRLEPWILMLLRNNKDLVRWVMTPEGIPLITEETLLTFLTQMKVGLSDDAKEWIENDNTPFNSETEFEQIARTFKDFVKSTGIAPWICEKPYDASSTN